MLLFPNLVKEQFTLLMVEGALHYTAQFLLDLVTVAIVPMQILVTGIMIMSLTWTMMAVLISMMDPWEPDLLFLDLNP